jgi:hypothetical protein
MSAAIRIGTTSHLALLLALAGCNKEQPSARNDNVAAKRHAAQRQRRLLADKHRRQVARRQRPRPRPAPKVLTLGTVKITGAQHYKTHAHGGKAASIYETRYRLQATGKVPVAVRVESLELLHAHCRIDGWSRASTLTIERVELDGKPANGPPHIARLATTKEQTLRIVFKRNAVYQACNRFGYRARFTVAGKSAWVEAPLRVTRREPLRRRSKSL